MRKWLGWWLLATLCWWLLLLPKQYVLFDFFRKPIQHLIYPLIDFIFGKQLYFEDTRGMYLLLVVAPILAVPFGFLPLLKPFFKGNFQRFFQHNPLRTASSIMRWFLVFELLEYGWIKLTKMQFYLPEPNTVYTEFGQLTKDIAWWSVAGSSPSYVIFMGIIEIAAALLIIVRRTRFVGLLLALGTFVQVVIINFSFDISVKLFSLSLLAMTVVLLTQYPQTWRAMLQLPVRNLVREEPSVPQWRNGLRALLLALIVTETLYPSVVSGNWNDDTAPRPPFHGAYAVQNEAPFEQLYVHRRGYLILKNAKEEQYSLLILSTSNDWLLLDEDTGEKSRFRILQQGTSCFADWRGRDFHYRLRLKPLPYRKLPLLKSSFHWFSDNYH